MANCPKCNAHLKITDWRPECPKCGVNMVYYGMEERLLADAEKAEAEHARFQKRLDKLKASLVASKLTIVRIILAFLPIGGLFLPLAKLAIADAPFIEAGNVTVNVLTIVNLVQKLDFDALFAMIGSKLVGSAFLAYAVSLVTLLLSVVLILLNLFRLLVSASKKSCIKNVIVAGVAIALATASTISFAAFASSINEVFPAFISGGVGFGAFIYIALWVPILVINLVLAKKGIVVKYKEVETYSTQMAADIESRNADAQAKKEAADEEKAEAATTAE